MAYENIARPGVSQGAYPERDPKAASERGALARWFGNRRAKRGMEASIDRITQSVHGYGEAMRELSDGDLAGLRAALQQQFAIQGLEEATTLRGLALVSEYASRKLGMRPYDVQVAGAWVMLRGMLAEMETGEGKTLTTGLAACAAALSGAPVHVMSANDYLVERDAASLSPLFEALGLSVGLIQEGHSDDAQRRRAYACDITYGTGKQIAFDYLRDRAAMRSGDPGERLLRGLCFAIVDEADSILIDEASTPLLLSRAAPSDDLARVYKRALRIADKLEAGRHFELDPRERQLALTPRGREEIASRTASLTGIWRGPKRSEEWIERALAALHLYEKDRDYLVRDDKVQIVDALTGRVSEDRSWGNGLHQLVELKEGCPLTPQNETIARISYQQFFRRYLNLAGTTGTASEVSRELHRVYDLTCVSIPTRLPKQREDTGLKVYRQEVHKWSAVLEAIAEVRQAGRPILVGTCSVADSEDLSRRLDEAGVDHQVLNARQDGDEAALIARAGEISRITVATNMAGRGTDIQLSEEAVALGGLHVIATEAAASARVDRQLIGRCARQGQPGSFQMIACLEDFLPVQHLPAWLRSHPPGSPRRNETHLTDFVAKWLLRWPQYAEECRDARMRRSLMESEEHLESLLAFSGVSE